MAFWPTAASEEIGFIFAFPMDQTSVRSGRLTKWTKEFAFDGVEGEDVVALLERAIGARTGNLGEFGISALANDTVGVLAAGAYLDPRCDMGLIVGTGANLAVAVPDKMIGRRDLPVPSGNPDEMIFNMECGNFDGVGAIQADADMKLDAESDTEGQRMEKMIAGRYLGEVARLRVCEIADRGEGFEGWLAGARGLNVPYAFATENLSDVAFDESRRAYSDRHPVGTAWRVWRYRRRQGVFFERFASRSRDGRRESWRRALRLTATYIDPDLDDEHIVAADGSVFRGMPGYQAELRRGVAGCSR